ncbi:MAG: cell division protein ZapA [Gammaproteobacteria bacterium]|nr:MAG: cell division protein ZapA [Gammaproteobacteria bacterium]
MSKVEPLTIKIMEKEYRIACPEEEKDNLRASADLLNDKLGEIKQQGSVIGTERIAIMAALNMSHEILHSQSLVVEHGDLNQRIDELSERISNSMRDIQLI